MLFTQYFVYYRFFYIKCHKWEIKVPINNFKKNFSNTKTHLELGKKQITWKSWLKGRIVNSFVQPRRPALFEDSFFASLTSDTILTFCSKRYFAQKRYGAHLPGAFWWLQIICLWPVWHFFDKSRWIDLQPFHRCHRASIPIWKSGQPKLQVLLNKPTFRSVN